MWETLSQGGWTVAKTDGHGTVLIRRRVQLDGDVITKVHPRACGDPALIDEHWNEVIREVDAVGMYVARRSGAVQRYARWLRAMGGALSAAGASGAPITWGLSARAAAAAAVSLGAGAALRWWGARGCARLVGRGIARWLAGSQAGRP